VSIYTRLCAEVLFPIHERLKRHDSVTLRKRLEISQWWSRERIDLDQFERLRSFLCDIGRRVPYYSRMFAEIGFKPEAIAKVTDLGALPLLDKAKIRANLDAMQAQGATALQRYNTGGSSGEPLVFYTSVGRRSHDVAAKWRATRWWGVDIGDPEMVVWGSPVELGAQDRIRILRDRILRSTLLPAFDMSRLSLDSYVARIRELQPAMIFGYPSSLSLIANHARELGVRLDALGIKVAFVTSERLYEEQRQAIEMGFGCPVANGYGGRDAGFIAHACPQGRMHLSAEDIVVEILDDHGAAVPAGTAGEIVVTHLSTADFPFVRYRTGDVGVLASEPCPCGRGLPVLDDIQGRSTDFVVARDGTVMHGLALIYVLRALDGIERFKIVQHDAGRTEVLIVAGPGFEPSCVEHIRNEFRKRLGASVEIAVDVVDTIAPEASGKYRYVVSKVRAAEHLQHGTAVSAKSAAHA